MKNKANIDSLIERIKRNLPSSIKINREEVIENVWEAMKLIGLKQDDNYYAILPIENKKVKLPLWIDNIEKVLYIPDGITINEIENDLNTYITKGLPVSQSSNFIADRQSDDYKYLLRNNYLHTNLDKGSFIILYNSIPIDENGEPLFNDDIHLIMALVWYNIKQYLWLVTIKNPNQFSQLFQKAEKEWSYYSINAKTENIFPNNEDSLKHLRNKYMKILPNLKV